MPVPCFHDLAKKLNWHPVAPTRRTFGCEVECPFFCALCDTLDVPVGTTFNEVRKTRIEGGPMNFRSVDLGANPFRRTSWMSH